MVRKTSVVAVAVVATFLLGLTTAGAATRGDHGGKGGRDDGEKKAKLVNVQVIAFNDFHGNLQPPSGSSGRIATPTGLVDAGGVEYLATHIKQLEATNPNTFVASAGDLIGASPLLSGLFHDEPTIEAMNLLGLDVNGVGNHEFDEGKAELLRMQSGGCHLVDGCQDGTPFYGSVFQFLAANVIDRSTNASLLPEYKIVKVGDTKIAFIGETLKGTPLIVTPAGVQGLDFLDEADTVNRLVPRLQQKGVETFVLLLHEGGQQAAGSFINDCNGLTGPIVDIVNRLSPAVDVVVSAHTHQPYNCRIGTKLVTSAASFGRLITDIDLTIDRRTGDVVSSTAENKIVTRTVANDPDQTALIDHYNAIAGPIANRIVGRATADITRTQNTAGESALGDVIADAQLSATSPSDFGGSVIAFMNPGGIRADLTYAQQTGTEAPGEVTYSELFTIQPFNNTLTVKTLTGDRIRRLLEQQFDNPSAGQARILQISASLTYSYDRTRPAGDRVDPSSMKLNGVTIDPLVSYRVTMNSFLASGGDGFSVFNEGTDTLGGEIDLDALVRYFQSSSPVAPGPQNRITRLG